MASSVTRKLLPVKLQNGDRLIFVCVPWKAFPCLDFERTSDKCEKCVPVSTNAKRQKCSLWIPLYGKCICQTGCFWTQNVLKQIKERAYLALFPQTQMLPHSVSSSTLKQWVIKQPCWGELAWPLPPIEDIAIIIIYRPVVRRNWLHCMGLPLLTYDVNSEWASKTKNQKTKTQRHKYGWLLT